MGAQLIAKPALARRINRKAFRTNVHTLCAHTVLHSAIRLPIFCCRHQATQLVLISTSCVCRNSMAFEVFTHMHIYLYIYVYKYVLLVSNYFAAINLRPAFTLCPRHHCIATPLSVNTAHIHNYPLACVRVWTLVALVVNHKFYV